ncbi:MAG: GNAT family N-acetyltransferase [Bacteroidales bacterium]|nr:GNAT family N-acetyltransferase [Bacteroidales bacterium]
MKKIVDAIATKEIEKELREDRLLRKTNNGNNEVYIFTSHECPALMHEVGRLRELTFRGAGGGTGKEIDLDEYDMSEKSPHQQLIVWDPENRDIIGGYRYFIHDNRKKKVEPSDMASYDYFYFSDDFTENYLPHLMELGRSFVQPDYQSKAKGRKSMYALDNLWDGLGAIVIENPNVKYLFGKVTMYPHFHKHARSMIIYFMKKHFSDPDKLVVPKEDISMDIDNELMESIFTADNYRDDYKKLSQEVRKLGETVPPLINAYMNLSPTMRTFGTIHNESFGQVNETGIMITVKDIYVEKINRHLASYRSDYDIIGQ